MVSAHVSLDRKHHASRKVHVEREGRDASPLLDEATGRPQLGQRADVDTRWLDPRFADRMAQLGQDLSSEAPGELRVWRASWHYILAM
jgi:hypothetical protein